MGNFKQRIWQDKICAVARILHTGKEEDNCAREILCEQMEQGWQGLTSEVAEICKLAGLPNVCLTYLNRQEVEEAIINHHLKEIKEEMETLSKLDKIRNTA